MTAKDSCRRPTAAPGGHKATTGSDRRAERVCAIGGFARRACWSIALADSRCRRWNPVARPADHARTGAIVAGHALGTVPTGDEGRGHRRPGLRRCGGGSLGQGWIGLVRSR